MYNVFITLFAYLFRELKVVKENVETRDTLVPL